MSTSTDTRRAPSRGKGAPGERTGRTAAPGRPQAGTAPSAKAARARAGGGQGRAPRIPFVLLVLCLLGGSLVSLLVLRSVVAEEAYAITSFQTENRQLSHQEQQLRDSVARSATSERISDEAEAMGMEQGEAPLFLDPGSGEITGSAGSDD